MPSTEAPEAANAPVAAEPSGELERVTTGIPGLDTVLRGGLVAHRAYLVVGRPGTGKTTLGNQVAYRVAADGGNALYVTLLAESHDRMLSNLSGYAFFDPTLAGDRVRYISLVDDLVAGDLNSMLAALRGLVLRHRASFLVIDGGNRLVEFAPSRREHERFLSTLLTQLGVLGCTTLFLSTPTTDLLSAVGTHADGIIELASEPAGAREVRRLRVVKCRGTQHLLGHHEMAITPAGIEVFPRLEAVTVARRPDPDLNRPRRPLGIAGLDQMLGGGLLAESTTLVFGPVGAGKTLTGLHFVAAGAARGERGIIASFQEAPERLVAKARQVGLDLDRHIDAGTIHVLWHPSLELLLDAWAHELLAAVDEHRPSRLLVDTITDAALLAPDSDRLSAFTAALVNALAARRVTTLLNATLRTVSGGELALPIPSVAGSIENIILLRYVERGARLRRLVSILKSGESRYDSGVREFVIDGGGMDVAGSIASAEEMLGDGVETSPASPSSPTGARPGRRSPRDAHDRRRRR